MLATGYSGTQLGDWGFMRTATKSAAKEIARRHLALIVARSCPCD